MINNIISRNEIKISLEKNKDNILQNFVTGNRTNIFSIKDFVFFLLYDKTNVILDYDEESKHFFIPDTLRGLFNLVELLNKMESYSHELKAEEDLEKFQQNIEWLGEDCNFRYKEEILAGKKEESSLITSWNEISAGQRGKQIISVISKKDIPLGLDIKREYRREMGNAKKLRFNPENIKTNPKYDNSDVEYSYAELVHSIFHMTRCENGYSKKFVACILYSYTLQLTEIYRLYLWNRHELPKEEFFSVYRNRYENKITDASIEVKAEKIRKYEKELLAVIGKTTCGKWAQYFFPEILPRRAVEMEPAYTGARHQLVIAGYIKGRGVEFVLSFMNSDSMEITALKIKTILFLAMLRLDVSKWDFKELECKRKTDGRYIIYFRQNEAEDIELTAFFKHTFLYTVLLNKIESLLLEPLENDGKFSQIKTKVKAVFSDLWESYYTWDQKYGNAMIPFYNLDVTYNMIKKLYLEYEQIHMDYVTITLNDKNTSFLNEYKKMLDRFVGYLKNLDRKYYLDKNGIPLSEIFTECPFYKMVDDLQNDPDSRVRISNYICNIGMDILSDRDIMTEPKG